MYCPSCGKETPANSTFCIHCGKPISTSATQTQAVTEWEYQDYHLDFPHGKVGWVSCEAYTEPAARLYYWQNLQEHVMPELQKWYDKGWQPISEVGPSCVEIRYFRGPWSETQNWLAHIIMIFVSAGLWLIILLLAAAFGKGEWRYEMSGFTVKMRRPKR